LLYVTRSREPTGRSRGAASHITAAGGNRTLPSDRLPQPPPPQFPHCTAPKTGLHGEKSDGWRAPQSAVPPLSPQHRTAPGDPHHPKPLPTLPAPLFRPRFDTTKHGDQFSPQRPWRQQRATRCVVGLSSASAHRIYRPPSTFRKNTVFFYTYREKSSEFYPPDRASWSVRVWLARSSNVF
jgi:hypothetical protein